MKKIIVYLVIVLLSILSINASNEIPSIEKIKKTEEELLKGKSNLYQLKTIATNDLQINGLEFINEFEYFVYGAYYTEPLYQTEYDIYMPYIAFYSHGELKWSKKIKTTRYARFTDATVTDTGVALIGEYDSESNSLDVIIYEISYQGNITLEKQIIGNSMDRAFKIFSTKKELLFVMESYSTEGDLKFSKGQDVVVGKISRKDIDNIDFIYLGNDLDDKFYDAVYLNQKLFIYLKVSGSGYFYFSEEYGDVNAIISISDRFELGEVIKVNIKLNEINKSLMYFNDKILFASNDAKSNQLNFLVYDFDLNYEKSKSIKLLNNDYEISDFSFYNNSNIKNVLTLSLRILNKYLDESLVVSSIDEDFNILYTSIRSADVKSYYKLSIYQNDSGDIAFADYSLGSKVINLYNLENYELKITKINNDKYEHVSKEYLYNGIKLEKELISEEIEDNAYGDYFKIHKLIDKDKQVIYLIDEYNYFACANVSKNSTYDLGLKLEFNGEGILNGNRVDTYHEITIEGYYTLLLKSKTGDEKIIPFQVKSLSEDDILVESNSPIIDVNIIDIVGTTANIINSIEFKLQDNIDRNLDWKYFIVPLVALTLGVVVAVICSRKTRSKNV